MEFALVPALFLVGLASGVHCVGMCGGIVTAFSAPQPLLPAAALWRRQLAFNAGRVSSYAVAGALAGLIGSGAYAVAAAPAQAALYAAANLMLVLIGLYLAGLSGAAAWLERLGAPLWRRLQPLAVRLRPHSFAAGAVWGWLPCGLVYGALATARGRRQPGERRRRDGLVRPGHVALAAGRRRVRAAPSRLARRSRQPGARLRRLGPRAGERFA